MHRQFTAKYTQIERGYMGQLVEWPEVVTEGKTLQECRDSLKDALQQMILAFSELGKELPADSQLFESLAIEIPDVR